MSQSKLFEEITHLHANVCSAISDPRRILLLYAIAENPLNVSGLAEYVEISQPAASRHLKVLHERGLVTQERQGASVIYSIADQRLIEALDLLREVLYDNLAHRADLINNHQEQRKG